MQYALRLTLVTDVLSSQIKLPAPGQPPLEQRRAARGTPLVEVVLHTSIWGAAVLTAIAGDRHHRALVSMGVVGVAGAAVAAWTEPDVVWWDAVTSVAGSTMFAAPPDEGVPPVESLLADEDPLDGLMLDTYGTGRVGGSSREAFLLDYPRHRIVWESARPPLAQCSERLFYEDLVDFLEWYKVCVECMLGVFRGHHVQRVSLTRCMVLVVQCMALVVQGCAPPHLGRARRSTETPFPTRSSTADSSTCSTCTRRWSGGEGSGALICCWRVG